MAIYLGPSRGSRNVGKSWVPQDVRRRRRDVENVLRRMGTPFLHKPRYNDLDFQNGVVEKSPVYDDVYEQTRNRDPFSHGVGYVSVEKSDNEWYDSSGTIVTSAISPGPGWSPAPKYRGYGKGTLAWVIQPDRSIDYFRAAPGGPLFNIQKATAITAWWPNVNDSDLLINVELDRRDNITRTVERYEIMNVNPVSIHGAGDKRGRRELGSTYDNAGQFPNSFMVNQTFDMNLIPVTDVAYTVETDR